MKTFKEQLMKDREVFFNTSEFAEVHEINGDKMPIIIDQDLLEERKVKHIEGTFIGEKLFLVETKYFEEAPTPDEQIILDGEYYFIVSCTEDYGIYEIVITKNEGY